VYLGLGVSHKRLDVCKILEGHVGLRSTARDAMPPNVERGFMYMIISCEGSNGPLHVITNRYDLKREPGEGADDRKADTGRSVSKQPVTESGFSPSGVLAFA
jgi:hypothetical protein